MTNFTKRDVSKTFAAQCRAARGLLNWSQEQLSERADVSLQQVIDYEGKGPRTQSMTTLLRGTFEAAGIRFLMGDEGFGVTWAPR
jgi:transcriptional regulator with XRE-family HTH domain